ncbi:MAG: hypothetical protein GT589_09445 [Peptoclostridium sp.]|uniref:hypothetical protein n=1 Tax=Peptoclostridium sp. TaxID=1904860 RepID=UPI00139C3AA4|nr:hypothetical protein [Peptoclostridium sp.]MZQ76359.1 hypothetical protein [Peptoclostridium sp.]
MQFKTIDFKTKAVLGTVIAGLMLSSGAMAFAASDSTSTDTKASTTVAAAHVQKSDGMPGMGYGRGGHEADMGLFGPNAKASLDALVSNEIISQSTADKITSFIEAQRTERQSELEKFKNMTADERKAYFEEKNNNGEKPDSILEQLVSEGILTQAQVDKIKDSNEQAMLDKQKEQLQALVDKGTLTSGDVDKIIEYMSAQREEREAEMDKIKNMSEDERKAYFEDKRSSSEKPVGMLEQMVEDDILTQEKADAVKSVFGNVGRAHEDF